MNTTNSPRGERAEDGRSHAVRRAVAGAEAWREVVHAQRVATPDHADFYALAGEMVETLRVLDSLVGVLAGQVAGYGGGRAVYDDEGADPACRLRSAVLALVVTRDELAQGERAANEFWSAIGHIGVETGPAGEVSR
ncbi:MAG: hypothetical protein J0I49_30175 [Pseudonocardia sp.]|uniref:hypothetical protein n=1 Tax=Pseudonocardia sp. TaxID=60912 RepID=UPI001AD220DB|nr:hypothetical protein [Pseudonocardia sp.]MBN9102333.1 hypothetical protein [Pseudonocardia sp.]